jgi:two-component system chemotaxis sensor kinase CheA
MDRPQVEASLLSAFREEFHHDLALLRQQWESYKPGRRTKLSDLADVRRILHTIKGSTRLLGFEGLPEQVHELEEMVLAALKKKQKPAAFWDALADLEEAVARCLGDNGHSVEFESEVVSGPGLAVPKTASTAYGFLHSVDELLTLSQALAEEVRLSGAPGPAHQAGLLVQRAKALRQEARRMTLVASSELFLGLTELARRLAAERGQSVRVVHEVAPDQLEREIVLGLRPALLHLVANAISHGIVESSGVITFTYQRYPTHLLVAVGDHGRGLDREALRQTVVGSGHLSEQSWQASTPSEQLQWLFHPGLSTRAEADLSSGRGMGLAVVAETMQRLGGTVEVKSSDQGTEFRLLVPASWNLRSVLRVRSGQHDFAVLSSELAAVGAPALDGATERNPRNRVEVAGELGALLGYQSAHREGSYRLILDKGDGKSLAIGVDSLGDFEQVLVSPLLGFTGLPAAMVGVTPFQGAPMPVISPRALLDRNLPRSVVASAPAATSQGPLLLVVDDSLTTRTLVTGILASQGYRVLVASDGQQGLELARSEGLAGIVSDLQMPVLDGLGFLAKLREDPATSAIPFLLLTSIDDVATFEKASALGADRCLGKQNFSQELLLATLRELL